MAIKTESAFIMALFTEVFEAKVKLNALMDFILFHPSLSREFRESLDRSDPMAQAAEDFDARLRSFFEQAPPSSGSIYDLLRGILAQYKTQDKTGLMSLLQNAPGRKPH